MESRRLNKRRRPVLFLATLGLVVWGCNGMEITGPDGAGEAIRFSREITLTDLEDALSAGSARVVAELFNDGLVARRVTLARPEMMAEPEMIEGRIIGIQTLEEQGTLSLGLGGLQVSFSRESRFGAPDRDELSFAQFVERVQALLGEGLNPYVLVKRAAPDLPQGPDVATFSASTVKLLAEGEGQGIALNVDGDNLRLNPNPQVGEPDGWLDLLGLSIELRVSDGVTELGTEEADVSDAVEFEGHVASVNLDAFSFTFTDGTIVRLVEATQIFEADVDRPLTSLAAVKEALAAGQDVVAWGGGTLEKMEPRTIVALELRFAVVGGGSARDIVEFEGVVTSVNLEGSSFTMKNGTIVRIVDETVIVTTGDGELLGSLAAAKEAIEAGKKVVAWGAGEVESAEPLTLIALEMRFAVMSSDPPVESFEGMVDTVSLEESLFTLTSGVIVRLVDGTMIKQAEQGQPLMSLQEVKEARDSGQGVIAWGKGQVEGVEPLKLAATEVYFVLAQ